MEDNTNKSAAEILHEIGMDFQNLCESFPDDFGDGRPHDKDGWTREELAGELAYYKNQAKGYKEFMSFLCDECEGSKEGIIRAVAEVEHIDFLGYVDGKPYVKDNKLYIKATVKDIESYGGRETREITADWQHSDNYAVWQVCEFEDSYKGYMLFPARGLYRFYCVWYNC
jgi:hypothetical protein